MTHIQYICTPWTHQYQAIRLVLINLIIVLRILPERKISLISKKIKLISKRVIILGRLHTIYTIDPII